MSLRLKLKRLPAIALTVACGLGVAFGSVGSNAISVAAADDGSKIELVYITDYMNATENARQDQNDATIAASERAKTGVRLKSTKSGSDANGSYFTFGNKFSGEFSMDFRIRSAQTYAQPAAGGWTHGARNGSQASTICEIYNPYADVQEIRFKFISERNENKYFEVFIRGSAVGLAFATSAGVYVPGDKMFVKSDEETIYGYGLENGVYYYNGADDKYGAASYTDFQYNMKWDADLKSYVTVNSLFTRMRGTSFSNYTSQKTATADAGLTTSNMIRFDAENMKVYVNGRNDVNNYNTYEADPQKGSETAGILVRDLVGNDGYVSKNGIAAGSLSAEDFADGYTVEVELSKMTTNECVSNRTFYNKWSKKEEDRFSAIGQYPNMDEPYDRYADMYVYSVNGTALTDGNYKLTAKSIVAPELALKDGVTAEIVYDYTVGAANKPQIDATDIDVTNLADMLRKRYDVSVYVIRPNGVVTYATKLNYLEAGVYTVVYNVTDLFGQTAEIRRTITVGDFSAPIISAAEEITATVGDKVDLTPYSVKDYAKTKLKTAVYSGDRVVSVGNEFTANKAGEYTVKYTATDESGNTREVSAKLTVYDAKQPIVIENTVNGVYDYLTVAFYIAGGAFAVIGLAVFAVAKTKKGKGGKTDE